MLQRLHVRAAQRAWSIYLAQHSTLIMEDAVLWSEERFLHQRLRNGETDVEELTCSGLSYLSRVSALEIMPDQW